MNEVMVDELSETLENLSKDPYGILLISGEGTSFSSGQDVSESTPVDAAGLEKYINQMQKITSLITSYPLPVVAKVQGYALGAGCEIALNADLIYAAEDAVFGFPELKVGLSITQGSSFFLPRLVGLQKAKEWIYFSQNITAKEMHELQVVNELIEKEELEKEVYKRLNTLYKVNKNALSAIKKLFSHGVENTLDEALNLEKTMLQELIFTERSENDD